jgi:hypothetical protein
VDTLRHAIPECNLAIAVWAMKEDDLILLVYVDATTDPKLWLFTLSNYLTYDKFIEVLVTLWSIWWARHNKLVHQGEFQSPLSTDCFMGGGNSVWENFGGRYDIYTQE